jgi:hypothetical protein
MFIDTSKIFGPMVGQNTTHQDYPKAMAYIADILAA